MTRRADINTIQYKDPDSNDLTDCHDEQFQNFPETFSLWNSNWRCHSGTRVGIDSATSDRADTAARTDGAKTAGILWPV